MSNAFFYICLLVLIVLFAGEPDLHDKLLERLSCPTNSIAPKMPALKGLL